MIPYLFTQHTVLAANGNTASMTLKGLENEITVYLGAGATFGSGTITPQVSYDGGTTWHAVPGVTYTSGTANTMLGKFTVYAPLVRFALTGATSPTLNIEAKAELVRHGNIRSFSFAANGSSDVFQIRDSALASAVAWAAQGTWGSGTLALQVSPDGGTTWRNVDTLTANGAKHAANVTDVLARLTLSGATSPALTAYVLLP